MKDTYVLLRLLEERLPSSRSHQRHNLMVCANTMVLTVMRGDTCTRFDLTEEDLDREPSEIASEVEKLVLADEKLT